MAWHLEEGKGRECVQQQKHASVDTFVMFDIRKQQRTCQTPKTCFHRHVHGVWWKKGQRTCWTPKICPCGHVCGVWYERNGREHVEHDEPALVDMFKIPPTDYLIVGQRKVCPLFEIEWLSINMVYGNSRDINLWWYKLRGKFSEHNVYIVKPETTKYILYPTYLWYELPNLLVLFRNCLQYNITEWSGWIWVLPIAERLVNCGIKGNIVSKIVFQFKQCVNNWHVKFDYKITIYHKMKKYGF